MKRQNFNHLYKDVFLAPLSSLGFEELRGKSLRYQDEERDLRIVNLGGKFAKPGALTTIICFRHNFLRPLQKGTAQGEIFDVREFCRKLTFYRFSGTFIPPTYNSQSFYRWGYDTLDFGVDGEREIESRLKKMKDAITDRVLPWAQTLTPESELAQLKAHGQNTWFERQWMLDYQMFIAGQSPAEVGR